MSIFSKIAEKLSASAKKPEGQPLSEIQESNDQSPDEQKIVEYVRKKVEDSRQATQRISLESRYLTNIAYLLGFDGVYYDTNYRQFKNSDPKRKLGRNRFKVNKILPSVQNRLARITQSPPRYDVRPKSNSTEDKDASRLALHVLDNVFDKQRFNEKRQDLHMATMQGGVAYLQVTWDPTLGDPMVDPQTGEFSGYEGDVRIEVLSCLEVFPDPLAKTIEECGHLTKAKVRKLDYFKEKYPERGPAVKEETSWLMSATMDMRANSMSSGGLAGASTEEQMKNSAIELVYYEKRSKDFPRGRKIVTANGVLLSDDELPVGEFDIVKFDDIIVGGRFLSEAVITHLIPIQDQYNVIRTKCAEWIRKMLAGKYLAAKGAGLGQEALNSESGEVVEFTPVPNAPPPTAMSIPMIPQYVYKDLETLDKEFDYISGINEISRGVLPSATIPAQGMAFLQEQDQTRIGVTTSRNELGYAKVGSLILKYVAKNYVMERMLKVAGEGLEYAVKAFVGSDLKDNTDCIVIAGSTIPSSKVLKRQDIANAFHMGILGNPMDPKVQAQVLKRMEYGDTDDMWKTQSLDEAQVRRVIDAIEKGDQVTLKGMLDEFDNHTLHLQEMNDYRKTDKYQKLSPDKQKLFKWIMEWRLQALVNIANPQIAQQQQMAEAAASTMEQNVKQYGSPGGPMSDIQNALTNPFMQQGQQAPTPQIDAAGNIQAPQPQQQQMQQDTPQQIPQHP